MLHWIVAWLCYTAEKSAVCVVATSICVGTCDGYQHNSCSINIHAVVKFMAVAESHWHSGTAEQESLSMPGEIWDKPGGFDTDRIQTPVPPPPSPIPLSCYCHHGPAGWLPLKGNSHNCSQIANVCRALARKRWGVGEQKYLRFRTQYEWTSAYFVF